VYLIQKDAKNVVMSYIRKEMPCSSFCRPPATGSRKTTLRIITLIAETFPEHPFAHEFDSHMQTHMKITAFAAQETMGRHCKGVGKTIPFVFRVLLE
jgi:hypothetical protein